MKGTFNSFYMRTNELLPSFFIIGTQKAATTTVFSWLNSHDEISLPNIKETHFFSDINKYKKGSDWYLKTFDLNTKTKIIGEVDPSYIYINKTAQRIHKFIKSRKIKFIIILRKPLERAYSHYLMHISNGSENRSFKEVIQEAQKPTTNDYVRRVIEAGFYNKQILNYQKFFPKKQIKIFLQ